MRKKIFYALLYLSIIGTIYYWFVIPTILITGNNLPELLESFVRFNIPQFFLAVFFITFPIVLMIIPKSDSDQTG
jgi:hypothetical protein